MVKFSVKKPFTILVAVVFVLILGVVSFARMTTDLLPEFSLPYVIVITTYAGASPEKVESTVTEPLESELGTVNGVVNVTSTSAENYGYVMLEFEENTNMDSAMVKLSSALDLVTLPDGAGTPMVMELSMDMMPVTVSSVDYEGMDIYELSDFVDETLVPEMERVDGVASVDTTGVVEKSVEIRLNQDKIDALNDKLAAYVNDELADAKAEIDDAQADLDDAQGELDDAQSQLDSQQSSTTSELASSSKLVDQAVATGAAYEANLTSLEASKTALETEKQAYEDAGVEKNYEKIDEALKEMGYDAGVAGYLADQSLFDKTKQSLSDGIEQVQSGITQCQSGIEQLQTAIDQMAAMGLDTSEQEETLAQTQAQKTELEAQLEELKTQQTAMSAITVSTVQQLSDAMDRIPQIETELSNLDTEIAAAEAVVEQVNSQVQQATDNYETLESGEISAAAGFGSGQAQIDDAQAQITSGQEQLDEAKESYEKSRDTALENANLDQLLNMDTLSQLIAAQNFAMPAGYIYQDEDQYLLKVGDEYSSEEELENSLLTNVTGVGDIYLTDVADVTWIDNAGDVYAKVNGEDGIVLSVSKASTAGTSTVSDNINAKITSLEEEYDGLHITNMMDQGDYIDLIVKNVLQNLIIGAILAIVVLAIFLKSIKPTLVVAFSIPLSVLVAIVLMYFSGITLNIMSLSGLALGIGMLVDNSVVSLENIYRLRGKGVPAARAAVMGAKQIAGAITASTLTTICVYFPIVFTSGLVKELFVDLALTMAYSLLASLLIALTVVPCMSASILKKAEPKPQPLLDKMLNFYEKVLRFCLKRKLVPIVIAAGLLVACGLKAVNTGLILLPSMGGDQMSVSMTVNSDLSDDEAFAVADEAMAEMSDIEGVDYVGALSGSSSGDTSSTSMLSGTTGGTHGLSFYLLLDEETAKDNSGVADQLDQICKGLDLEDYSVSTSNMDFSSYFDTGLSLNIYGEDPDELVSISEDVMDIVADQEGFENISNGQEDPDETIELTVDKDKAASIGLTVAQVVQELSTNLTTEDTATTLTIDGKQYDVVLVNENDSVDVDDLMDYEFETEKTDDDGETVTETHKLSEFASMERGTSLATITRENQKTYITVTADTKDGYNTTLQTRELEQKLENYDTPDGYTIEVGGEMDEIMDALKDVVLMIILGIAFIYLIMVAQFQSLLSPFIVLFTIPLAFTGGFLAIFISGSDISLVGMMGFLMLVGVVVNNGIVFVDYANQLRLGGMEKREALVETGRSRMRPILMTMLTTVLAMSTMIFSKDAAAEMTKGMAVVVIGGLLYATLMTLFIVPVLYDLLFRKELKVIDVGTDEELKEDL